MHGNRGSFQGSRREVCSYCRGQGRVIQSAGIVRIQTTCPACHGQGSTIKHPCPTCRGSGQTLKKVVTEVQIPPGVDDDMRVRITGQGEPSPNSGPPGDCYCFISVLPHPLFDATVKTSCAECRSPMPRRRWYDARGANAGRPWRVRDPRWHAVRASVQARWQGHARPATAWFRRPARTSCDRSTQKTEQRGTDFAPRIGGARTQARRSGAKDFFAKLKEYFTAEEDDANK